MERISPSILFRVAAYSVVVSRGVRAGAFKPGVDDQLLQLFQCLLHPAVPGREADLFFQLLEGRFAMLDGVPRPLPGDAEVSPISLRERSSL